MSDSDRWWVIALLIVFMVGGLLWLLWSRMRRDAPTTTASVPDWGETSADELGGVPMSAAISTADVTMSRDPFAAGAATEAGDAAPREAAGMPAADVGEVARAESDESLAAGGDLPAETAVAPTGGTPLDDLAPDAGVATVGSELSDTAWAADAVDVAPPDAAAADALVGDIERPAPVAEPVSADLEVAAEPAGRESAPAATAAIDHGRVDAGDDAPTISAFAAMPEAVTADAEPTTLTDAARVGGVEAMAEAEPLAEHEVAVDAGASAETGSVVVSEVHHGTDGHDHEAGEWVVLTNGSSDAITLAGWRLTDEGAKHEYTFPAYTIAAGDSVRVHMARGEDAGADLYCGQSVRWWNNEGDCAYLYDASGALVNVHCYGTAVAGPGLATPADTGDAQVAEVHHGADGHEHGDREWVLIVNNDQRPLQLEGWRLTDEGAKHTYTFGGRVLAPGGSVRVYMARGDDGEDAVYVGREQRWWNNEGDCAYLYDGSGRLVHVHCYGDATASA